MSCASLAALLKLDTLYNHLSPAHPADGLAFKTKLSQLLFEGMPGIVYDVIIGVTTRSQVTVKELDRGPGHAAIVRCVNDQATTWLEQTGHLCKQDVISRQMLNHL